MALFSGSLAVLMHAYARHPLTIRSSYYRLLLRLFGACSCTPPSTPVLVVQVFRMFSSYRAPMTKPIVDPSTRGGALASSPALAVQRRPGRPGTARNSGCGCYKSLKPLTSYLALPHRTVELR